MGFIPLIELLKYTKVQREAAKQMWAHVRRGVSFEVPVSLSTDDNTMKALECMCKQHPEVVIGEKTHDANGAPLTLQSRGIIIGLRKNIRASAVATGHLAKNGYMPDNQNLLQLFDDHAAFIKNHTGMTPEQAVHEGQMEAKDRNRIVLTDQQEFRDAMDKVETKTPLQVLRLEKGEVTPEMLGAVMSRKSGEVILVTPVDSEPTPPPLDPSLTSGIKVLGGAFDNSRTQTDAALRARVNPGEVVVEPPLDQPSDIA